MPKLLKILRKRNSHHLDIIKILDVNMDDADRIIGGMMRLEGKYVGHKYVIRALKLAKTESETNFIWYMVGVKIGLMMDQGFIIPFDAFKKLKNKGNVTLNNNDVSVQ